MDSRIATFLSRNSVASLSTCVNNKLHSAICFYAFDEATVTLLFKSSSETNHVANGLLNPTVSGTILPDIRSIGKLQGVQFTALFSACPEKEEKAMRIKYHRKFPLAATIGGNLWYIKLRSVKMTDNTLGFGKKILWEAESK